MARLSFAAFLLALFVVGALGASQRILGSEKCTWGPAYWCSGLTQSAKCKATHHCINTVWKTNTYPVDDDDICTICKNMVAEARDELESNDTQVLLKEVFDGSCNLIPVKLIAAECCKIADEFVPELVETLASEMNPDTVCSVAGLCNSKRIDKLMADFYRQHPPTYCEKCKTETRKIVLKVREMNKDDLVDKMLDICGQFSSYSDSCKATILDNFELIYGVLTSMDDGLCELLSVCDDDKANEIVALSGDDIQCQFCTKVIKHWIDVWTANVTESEFKQVLETLCHKLHDEREAQCLYIVDGYAFQLFNYLAHQVNPRDICATVGLCGDGGFLEIPEDSSISMLLPTKQDLEDEMEPKMKFTGNDEVEEGNTVVLVGGYFTPESVQIMSKPSCVICEYVLHELENLLKDKKTKEAVEEAMDQICNVLPEQVKSQCNNYVDTYGRAVIELLANGVDPKQVCTMLQLCDNSDLVEGMQMSPVLMEAKKESTNCEMCEFAMNYVFEILQNKDDREEIRNVLETICSKLPSSVADRCESLVHNNIDAILNLIDDNLSPEEICSALSMCAKKKQQPTSQGCVLCEYVVQTLETLLQNKTDKDAVKDALDNLCSYLPSSISNECITFVNSYTDAIIDFIVQGVTPEQICIQLALCDPPSRPIIPSVPSDEDEMLVVASILADEAETSESERPYCLLCEYAITEVDKLIQDKQNEEEIKTILDKICYELGQAPIKDQCLKMIDQYTDKIIELIVSEYTPEQICAELRLCKPKTVELFNQRQNEIDSTFNEEPTKAPVKFGPTCVLCEFAMSILKKQILTNASMDMAERAVLALCSFMPETVADKCEDFVYTYGDAIIQLIVEAEMDPEAVCSALALCSQSKLWDATPVGGQPCPWGPTFWCQSPVHAEACGTFNYCRKMGISFDD